MDFNHYELIRENSLSGRWLNPGSIAPLLTNRCFTATEIGRSVNGIPIHCIVIGKGKTKILMWSQMHGNESTTTKAVFDLLNYLDQFGKDLLSKITIGIVPMLNPDGSERYTRENANGVDLNRDFCNLSQPESRALIDFAESFDPDFCFNLHDQRTIYGVGDSGKPATVAFLAPAFNESREINEVRARAMTLIAVINDVLQTFIPGQVARFDDNFNLNCVGDTFQHKGVPTILFEAGHYPGDYQREMTRKLIFKSLLVAVESIGENDITEYRISDYLNISQNKINFYDIVYKNVNINYDSIELITNFATQFVEVPENGKIVFKGYIAETGSLEGKFGHIEIDAGGALFQSSHNRFPEPGDVADFMIGNRKFINGIEE